MICKITNFSIEKNLKNEKKFVKFEFSIYALNCVHFFLEHSVYKSILVHTKAQKQRAWNREKAVNCTISLMFVLHFDLSEFREFLKTPKNTLLTVLSQPTRPTTVLIIPRGPSLIYA